MSNPKSDVQLKPLLYVMQGDPGTAHTLSSGAKAAAVAANESASSVAEAVLDAAAISATLVMFPVTGLATAAALAAVRKARAASTKGKGDHVQPANPWLDTPDGAMWQVSQGLAAMALVSLSSLPPDLLFPPGHPQPGNLYRLHPLAGRDPRKSKIYIPVDLFESVLFQEREGELVRVLVDLGATSIRIHKARAAVRHAKVAADIDAGPAGGVSAGAGAKDSEESTDTRVFVLRGKPWMEGHSLNLQDYGWLAYEPSWLTVAHAREQGFCTQARIELTHRASFSVGASLGLKEGLLSNLAGASLSGDLGNENSESYIVDVTFADALPAELVQQLSSLDPHLA